MVLKSKDKHMRRQHNIKGSSEKDSLSLEIRISCQASLTTSESRDVHTVIISTVTENSRGDNKQQSCVLIQGFHGQDIPVPFCHFTLEVV